MKEVSRYKTLFTLAVLFGELLVLGALYSGLWEIFDRGAEPVAAWRMLLVFIALSYLVSTLLLPLRVDAASMRADNILREAFARVLLTMSVAIGCIFIVGIQDGIPRAFLVLFGVTSVFALCLLKVLLRGIMVAVMRNSRSRTRAVILGADALGHKIYDEVTRNPYLGVAVIGFFDDNPAANGGEILGTIDHAKEFVITHDVKQIYCALPVSARDRIVELIDFAEANAIRFHVVPALRNYIDLPMVLETVGGMPILSVRNVPLGYAHNAFAKRVFDFTGSLLFLLTIFPIVFIVTALVIKLTSRGPIFFCQERTGRAGHNFTCYKFRSMHLNESSHTAQATPDDERQTPIGAFLRRTSIDELPQFLNVLRGDMSIVGPRPHMKYHTWECSRMVDKYMVRHLIKPGITGLAQVTGSRGPMSDATCVARRVRCDIWYIEHWSLSLDIKIILKTVPLLFEGYKNIR